MKDVTEISLEELKQESTDFAQKIKAERERLNKLDPNRQVIEGNDLKHLSAQEAERMTAVNDEIARREAISTEEAKKRVQEKRAKRLKAILTKAQTEALERLVGYFRKEKTDSKIIKVVLKKNADSNDVIVYITKTSALFFPNKYQVLSGSGKFRKTNKPPAGTYNIVLKEEFFKRMYSHYQNFEECGAAAKKLRQIGDPESAYYLRTYCGDRKKVVLHREEPNKMKAVMADARKIMEKEKISWKAAFKKAQESYTCDSKQCKVFIPEDLRILKSSKKGAMLVTDGQKTAWIMPKMQRADGSFTPGAYKALKESENTYEAYLAKEIEKEEGYALQNTKELRSTEKAYQYEFDFEGGKITSWFPKAKITLKNGKPVVDGKFWQLDKLPEILKKIEESKPLVISGTIKEYDNSYGLKVIISEHVSDQFLHRMMFFPKKLTEMQYGHLIVPEWLFLKKKEELFHENESGSFHARNFHLEGIGILNKPNRDYLSGYGF